MTGYKILAKDVKWEELHGREANVEDSIKVNIMKIVCAILGQMYLCHVNDDDKSFKSHESRVHLVSLKVLIEVTIITGLLE